MGHGCLRVDQLSRRVCVAVQGEDGVALQRATGHREVEILPGGVAVDLDGDAMPEVVCPARADRLHVIDPRDGIGASLAIIPNEMYSTVIIMSVLTTLVVPPILTLLYGGQPATPEPVTDYAVADGRLPDL